MFGKVYIIFAQSQILTHDAPFIIDLNIINMYIWSFLDRKKSTNRNERIFPRKFYREFLKMAQILPLWSKRSGQPMARIEKHDINF